MTVDTPDSFTVDINERSAYKLTDVHAQSVSRVSRAQLGDAVIAVKIRAAGH